MALANVGGVVDAPDLGAQELGCEIPIYGVRPDGVDENDGPPKCGGGGDDGGGTDGTGGGETGGDDTMPDDSGGKGDGGDDGGGDSGGYGVGGDGNGDLQADDGPDGCACGFRNASSSWLAIAACGLLSRRRRLSRAGER
jgi:hypothetical protein